MKAKQEITMTRAISFIKLLVSVVKKYIRKSKYCNFKKEVIEVKYQLLCSLVTTN